MRVAIVFDHPYTATAYDNEPHRRSFSAALLHAAMDGLSEAGHEIDLFDLQADGFNPVMSAADLVAWRRQEVLDPLVRDYQQRLSMADHLVFVFPVWWESMPASTKGFLDKCLTEGFAYQEPPRAGARFINLLTNLQGVTLLTVTSIPTAVYRLWFKQPAPRVLFRGTFNKMGFKNFKWMNYAGVSDKSLEQRQDALARTALHFRQLTSTRPQRVTSTR